MFGWKKAECPVAVEHRIWFEDAARWLVAEFGERQIRSVVVALPEPRFFPGKYDASRESIRGLFDAVARHMRVDPSLIDVDVYDESTGRDLIDRLGLTDRESSHAGTAGRFRKGERSLIFIEASPRRRLHARIATIAHELSHHLLLGEGRLDPKYPHGEALTEMTAAFLGFGVFNANSYVQEGTYFGERGAYWSIGRLGYFDAASWAYTLALFAWFRNEPDPAWAKHLRGDIRTPFKKSMRYLASSGLALGELPAAPTSSAPARTETE